jgi:hypothetical protein
MQEVLDALSFADRLRGAVRAGMWFSQRRRSPARRGRSLAGSARIGVAKAASTLMRAFQEGSGTHETMGA